jgi:hypothetical protein
MRLFLIGLIGLLISGCAQVGFLSGGEKDEYAPVPKINPENSQTQFKGNSIEFTFNEYVTLNNPKENIFMMPQVDGIQTNLKKKTLTVSWTETLLPNTTYVLYLNNAVKDLHEGNDSLMTYVFSTGSEIDSLNYEVDVVDAWTNEPLKNVFVGLYADTAKLAPLYFSRSNAQGKAQFTNLKSGTYAVRSFPDEDKDRKPNKTEKRGFRESVLILDSSVVDTLPIRLSASVNQKIRNAVFLGPGLIGVGASFPIEDAEFRILGNLLPNRFVVQSDSLLLSFCPDTLVRSELEIKHDFSTDTLRIAMSKREKNKPLNWKSETIKKGLAPHQRLELEINDLITSFNKDKILIRDLADSSTIEVQAVRTEFNRLILEFDRKQRKSIEIKLDESAVTGACGKGSEPLQQTILLKSEKDFGSLTVKFLGDEYPLIVELLNGNTVIERKQSSSMNSIHFNQLEPAEYSFRVIVDSNKNGRWDVGEETENRQPERVLYFSTPTKVRGNWESEVELDLNQ